MALPQAIDMRISMLRLAHNALHSLVYIYIYIYRRARCTTRTCGARSGSPQLNSFAEIR